MKHSVLKRIFVGSLAVLCAASPLPANITGSRLFDTALVVNAAEQVTYLDANFSETTQNVFFTEKTCTGHTAVESTTTTFEGGKWYVVSEDVTISERIAVSGTANLILTDGKTLTAEKGIELEEGNTLNIYAQSGGTGKLAATGSLHYAGIDSDWSTVSPNCGTLNIYGGEITAEGNASAGIGGQILWKNMTR